MDGVDSRCVEECCSAGFGLSDCVFMCAGVLEYLGTDWYGTVHYRVGVARISLRRDVFAGGGTW